MAAWLRPGQWDQGDLLAWRAAPTTSGPRTDASDGDRTVATPADRWAAFVAAHPAVATDALAMARAQASTGRVGVKAIAEAMRAKHRTPLNNTMTAAMADWLVAQDPSLGDVIERRVRKADK